MKYTQTHARLSNITVWAAAILIAAGGYVALLALSPLFGGQLSDDAVRTISASYQDKNQPNAIIIAKIGLHVPFYTGDAAVLERGAWHRQPDRGNPVKGGNFIVSAHRFEMGLTPHQTRARSPFYRIDRLIPGDTIIIVYNQKEYTYAVSRIFSVPPQQSGIEAPSDSHKLTLYSCTLGGSADGRVVIEAQPVLKG